LYNLNLCKGGDGGGGRGGGWGEGGVGIGIGTRLFFNFLMAYLMPEHFFLTNPIVIFIFNFRDVSIFLLMLKNFSPNGDA
jgi:hypothetical protein